jgi:type I restriction enzyme M protein
MQLQQIEAIEKRLWETANTLRTNSNYASNEYFMPVMGLIFLRHAYSRFLAVKDGIGAGLPFRRQDRIFQAIGRDDCRYYTGK